LPKGWKTISELGSVRRIGIEGISLKHGGATHLEKTIPASPIGVFDSGVGGLTVLVQLSQQLPHEDIIYLADTARIPYGSKSTEEIIKINQEIVPFLIKKGAKLIIMACGTSSAIAYPVIKDEYPIEMISLIEPGAHAALASSKNGRIGVIATAATVNSHAYQHKLKELNSDVEVHATSCPLFVPLIEGGFTETEETKKVAKEYLHPLLKEGIDTLILGCTHYPHLSKVIQEICGHQVILVDPAQEAVLVAQQMLKKADTLKKSSKPASHEYFTTTEPAQFEMIGSRLLGKPIIGTKQVSLS